MPGTQQLTGSSAPDTDSRNQHQYPQGWIGIVPGGQAATTTPSTAATATAGQRPVENLAKIANGDIGEQGRINGVVGIEHGDIGDGSCRGIARPLDITEAGKEHQLPSGVGRDCEVKRKSDPGGVGVTAHPYGGGRRYFIDRPRPIDHRRIDRLGRYPVRGDNPAVRRGIQQIAGRRGFDHCAGVRPQVHGYIDIRKVGEAGRIFQNDPDARGLQGRREKIFHRDIES